MSRTENQMSHVLAHLQSGKPITSMQAFELYGCTRLADKVHKLRKRGYNIVTIDRETTNRYGDTCVYAEYRLYESEREY